MFDYLDSVMTFVESSNLELALGLFFFTITMESTRYLLGFIAVLIARPWRDFEHLNDFSALGKISLIVAGHNEESAIERCVRSLDRQTFKDFEIICVDDGSTDKTYQIMTRLEREGLIHRAVRLELRGGKASALNMAMRLAKGDIYIILDADSKLEDTAVEEVLRPLLMEPNMAAVSGTVLLENPDQSIITRCQAVEYAVGIPVGRTLNAMLDQLVLVSGAFGAFRANAVKHVNGMDVGPGEDFDVCLRMRAMGYNIGFTHKSLCYTEAPHAAYNLVRQRLRWERDAVWIRFRKLRFQLNPFSPKFRAKELFHTLDFLVLTIIPSFVAPISLFFLFLNASMEFVLMVLLATQVLLTAIDSANLVFSAIMLKRPDVLKLLPWVPVNGVFTSYIMRIVRLFSYIDEWIFSRSLHDDFAPFKVQNYGTGYR